MEKLKTVLGVAATIFIAVAVIKGIDETIRVLLTPVVWIIDLWQDNLIIGTLIFLAGWFAISTYKDSTENKKNE